MGKGRPRAVERLVLGQNLRESPCGSLNIPQGPVYYPTEDEFKDPLEYIYKIRPEAEPYGICKIVPPKNWKPPFALDLNSFTFPTKTQAIHRLQARPAACDSKTFELEYNRFLESHCGRKLKKRVVFEGEELDLCKLFNAVKRCGGFDKVVKEKKWGEVFRFVRWGKKISECSKHVLCQLYSEHLFDYEGYYNRLNCEADNGCKRRLDKDGKGRYGVQFSESKRRRGNSQGEKVRDCKLEEKEEYDQICEQCRSGLHGEVMLLCDRCNKGWHIYCLSPPLKQVPPGNWYCLECLNSDNDNFGFVPGKNFSLEAFRRVADRAKKKWFGAGSVSRVQLEKKFWEIVEGSAGEVEVMYGSDLDTSVYGSGFPRINDQRPESVEVEVWDEYCGSPWNLNNLSKLKGSMLRAVHHNITGVMVPWLYVGMLFSSFCWHFEDHCFYSMNYLHWGEPKCWYSVPGSEAGAFEKVMRNSLPDLFDTQPDLLFQLVTMLDPSVLLENGVPVYSVLQEPGNFVITFPRSFHAGFNFGLNCAEAVNFAPADWLPHGGIGAELYQLYHKAAVLAHEELLCVVAKGDCDSKVSPHLKKELLRIYTKESTWREQLWRNGIIRSSPMSPRKYPEYVGTEQDPTCIICQQYLYLSAVVCLCRPSAFVCLEHWEHLCECKPSKLRLLYRHTLAELYDLVISVDIPSSKESIQSKNTQLHMSSFNGLCALTKKVKGSRVSMVQLAEQWLLRSCKVLQNPYSSDAYITLLKESEQYLWAGADMDPVRDVTKNLIEAQNWAKGIKECLLKVECHLSHDLEKVHLEYVDKFLSVDRVPCNEPGHLKLKNYAEDARLLIQDVNSALSTCSKIPELELLYSRACDFPIFVEESEKLCQKISSVKVWVDSVKRCISESRSAAIDVDNLYKLKSEMLELQVQLPETEMLLDLLRQAESCQARCSGILTGSVSLKNIEVLLEELDNFTVSTQELKLLKQYHADAVSWIARFKGVLVNVHEREDQHNVVDELNCILKDGASLRIQGLFLVDELSLVEVELKKACCREKALKARVSKLCLDCVQQLMEEAVVLQIDREKLFVDMSGVLAAAMRWEERATEILSREAYMFDFEDAISASEDIGVVLPSLESIKDAVYMAKSWLEKSEPFLVSASSVTPASCSLLTLDALKDLVFQSKFLKLCLEERRTLETVLKNCMEWENDAYSAMQDAGCLFDTSDIGDGICNGLVLKIESLVTKMECIIKAGLSFRYYFREIPKLQNACSMLQWCNKTLSFCSLAPCFEEVGSLMEAAENLSVMGAAGTLWSSMIEGVRWLKKASEMVSTPLNFKRCKLSDAEQVLAEAEVVKISFPVMVGQLVDSIQKHKLWKDKVHKLFSLKPAERSWSQILELKEAGKATAFSCPELVMILSEVEKVEMWNQLCSDVLGTLVGCVYPILGALQKIKQSLDRSLDIYEKSWNWKDRSSCICCTIEDQEFLSCSTCKDRYHLRCLGPTVVDPDQAEGYVCPYCQIIEGESVSYNDGGPLIFEGKRPELQMLIELLSDAENLCIWVEGRDILRLVVNQAHQCKNCFTEIVDFALSYLDKDLSIVSNKLTIALKAVEVAGVHDHQGNCKLELALARNSWRIRGNRLLEGFQKPTIHQIQRHLKEGLIINISPKDHFRQRLTELKHIGLQWAEHAKKVATDSGALGLDKVFELITVGENLPVYLDKELKLLRARSMLHCICRMPYDERSMIACNKCDERYHLYCINLPSPPNIYVCPACKPQTEESSSTPPMVDHNGSISFEPVDHKTPSHQHKKSSLRTKRGESSLTQKLIGITNGNNIFSCANGIDRLWWRNRKPFRRAARKRAVLDSLLPFFHIQQ
ncbi:PHD domain-containing protein/ARID domain-containing protein/JmjC domain-containing protein/JmjN domain-containing protein/zf-C5HC2 domain-containing protein/PLU-1 domain-containing protein [Cephalotus follicularis]|uniref:PHD domain-containing protein/ARID domain-containing protein/JmjC domain-containing protein/JmjN domain-containing protein/zf-C5HC2 domain-containing protein/PLU-1 domain-containing protein n=1 Tax=Cephalotus follicularis TaxID=3775 RepID=A0A1Q3AQA7_CEPFO|nr:PHD domain-containing protein/ARID domain-containing protein/JmjC domain-containing protein/JmjN domain-containing protein/zf-C5HC2 domain-containing protein/PLU-1 domain-containing protein [Cephalotus follicularis]